MVPMVVTLAEHLPAQCTVVEVQGIADYIEPLNMDFVDEPFGKVVAAEVLKLTSADHTIYSKTYT